MQTLFSTSSVSQEYRHYLLTTFVAVLLVWLYSFWIRIPYIHAETYSANDCHNIMFTTWQVWDSSGIVNCCFAPRQTYHHAGDKFITYFKRLEDAEGNNYYASYPTLSYVVTYYFFQCLGIHTVAEWSWYLYIINLCLHGIGACAMAWLVLRQYPHRIGMVAAIMSATFYLLMPAMLHLHLHIYFPEMWGQSGLLFCLVATQLYLLRPNYWRLCLLAIATFVLCSSEWLGLFWTMAWLIVVVGNSRQKWLEPSTIAVFGAALLSFALTLLQFMAIAGYYKGIRSIVLRLVMRSGYFSKTYSEGGLNVYHPKFLTLLCNNLNGAIGWYSLWLLGMMLVYYYYRLQKNNSFLSNNLFALALLSVTLYSLLFINAVAFHLHLVAKFALPLSLAIGIVVVQIFDRLPIYLAATACFGFVVAAYHTTQQYIPLFRSAKPDPYLVATAKIIQANQQPNAAIFVHFEQAHPPTNAAFLLTSYVQRNLQLVGNKEQAIQTAQTYHHRQLHYFCFGDNPAQFDLELITLHQ